MTWPPGQRTKPPHISWMLQVQYKPDGWWSDHTAGLYDREEADELMAERRAANPQLRYRLIRVTTTHTIEREPSTKEP